jgi:DNA mismatch endonuclease (patch repair protein)
MARRKSLTPNLSLKVPKTFRTTPERSQLMSCVRSYGNRSTELRMLAILRENRITGWRRHLPLPGRPDFAFPKLKVAVYVDGCFWHGCPKCYAAPKSNVHFWFEKRAYNAARDRAVVREMKKRGWVVVRLWEHSLRQPNRAVRRVRSALQNV